MPYVTFCRHLKIKHVSVKINKKYNVQRASRLGMSQDGTYKSLRGFLDGSVVKNWLATQQRQETGVRSLGQEDPLEEEVATHSSILFFFPFFFF